jgi:hypothetical protein
MGLRTLVLSLALIGAPAVIADGTGKRHLVCQDAMSGASPPPISITIDFRFKTVNETPAVINEHKISWQSDKKSYTINRFTGLLNAISLDTGYEDIPKQCVVMSRRQF